MSYIRIYNKGLPSEFRRYYKDKKYQIIHREDGPALVAVDGEKRWYINGQPHRVDGPAIEYANGAKEWWINGKRHREDGAAIINTYYGEVGFYLNGIEYTEKEYWAIIRLGSFV